MLNNWKMDDRKEAGFSLNNRAKRKENPSGWHHAHNYHRFQDIYLSLFR